MPSKIQWTDETYNPITGCTPISPGCKNCYAKRMSRRLAGRFGYPEAPHNFDVTWHPDKLDKPLHWKKPRRIFVCSMSDLFHKDVDIGWIRAMMEVMVSEDRHAYQILTKRPQRMLECLDWLFDGHLLPSRLPDHIWIGVTVCNQNETHKIATLLQIPAAVRFVSLEPMLEPINFNWITRSGYRMLSRFYGPDGFDETGSQPELEPRRPDQIIVGAETGPGARPMDLDWARSIRGQCVDAGVPFFFKRDSQGRETLDGETWHQFPEVKDAQN